MDGKIFDFGDGELYLFTNGDWEKL